MISNTEALTAVKAAQLAKIEAKIADLMAAGDATEFSYNRLFAESITALQSAGYTVTQPYIDNHPDEYLIKLITPS